MIVAFCVVCLFLYIIIMGIASFGDNSREDNPFMKILTIILLIGLVFFLLMIAAL